jgi:hypothetical protein
MQWHTQVMLPCISIANATSKGNYHCKYFTMGFDFNDMALDEVGKGGGGNNSLLARLACPILVVYAEPKK